MFALRDTGMLSKWHYTAAVEHLEIPALAWINQVSLSMFTIFSNSIHLNTSVGFHQHFSHKSLLELPEDEARHKHSHTDLHNAHKNLGFLSVNQFHVRRTIAQHYIKANKLYLCLEYNSISDFINLSLCCTSFTVLSSKVVNTVGTHLIHCRFFIAPTEL